MFAQNVFLYYHSTLKVLSFLRPNMNTLQQETETPLRELL